MNDAVVIGRNPLRRLVDDTDVRVMVGAVARIRPVVVVRRFLRAHGALVRLGAIAALASVHHCR